MKIVSVNIAAIQNITFDNQTVETGIFKRAAGSPVFLKKTGFLCDAIADKVHHGGAEKACYAYGLEPYQFWKEQYPNLPWEFGMFGENLTISGLDEANIHIGDVFKIGEAVVQVSQPRQPCYKLGFLFNDPFFVTKFQRAPYPGMYLRVLQEGNISHNDVVETVSIATDSLTVLEVFQLLYAPNPDFKKIHKAISLQYLSPNVKQYLQKKYHL